MDSVGGTARFIRNTDIAPDGTLINNGPKYLNANKDNEGYLLKVNDLLVARTGATFGKTLQYNNAEPAVYASYLIWTRFPVEKVLPEFYWAYSQSLDYWILAQKLMTGGGQPQFNGNVSKEVILPVPPLDSQKKIVDKIASEHNTIDARRELIAIYEEKVKGVIDRVCG